MIVKKKMIKNKPLVSIITPVFNGHKYLEECIQSVLKQSYHNIEHIIIDGGSTDGTLDILRKYKKKYPNKIRFISEPDKGAGDAWNKGLKMAKGDIFGWLGSDDTFEPNTIQTIVKFFRSNPDAYFVFGGCNIINEEGKIMKKFSAKKFDLKQIINNGNYVPTPSTFYRRKVIERIGGYDEKGNDLDYLIRAGKVFKIYRIQKILSNFRVHKNSISNNLDIKKRIIVFRDFYKVSRQYGGSIFSYYSKRYFGAMIFFLLRPILCPLYHFTNPKRPIKNRKSLYSKILKLWKLTCCSNN